MNWEADAYTIERKADGVELLEIIVGAGAYDLSRYRKFCLNHKRAWRATNGGETSVIVGSPGVNAVFALYENLSRSDAKTADAMLDSLSFSDGTSCPG